MRADVELKLVHARWEPWKVIVAGCTAVASRSFVAGFSIGYVFALAPGRC